MRDLVEGMSIGGTVVLATALHMLAAAAGRKAPAYVNGMGYAAVSTLLLVIGFGLHEIGISEARDVIALGVLGWLSAVSAALLALLLQPPGFALWNGWKEAIRAHRAEVKRWREKEETNRFLATLPPLPPPTAEPVPSPDDDLKEVMRRDKENRERVERSPLTREQKDELLRELDVLLQARVRGTME